MHRWDVWHTQWGGDTNIPETCRWEGRWHLAAVIGEAWLYSDFVQFVCKPEVCAKSVQRCADYMRQQMCAWKIWPSTTFGTWCHLSVLFKYSCDFLMCLLFLLFSSAPSTEWRWDALKTEVILVGKGNISEQWIQLEKAAQKSWGSLIKTVLLRLRLSSLHGLVGTVR